MRYVPLLYGILGFIGGYIVLDYPYLGGAILGIGLAMALGVIYTLKVSNR